MFLSEADGQSVLMVRSQRLLGAGKKLFYLREWVTLSKTNPVTMANGHIGEKFSTIQEMGVLVPSHISGRLKQLFHVCSIIFSTPGHWPPKFSVPLQG